MVVEGPQFLKLIVSETMAGAIIGKDGTKLGEFEMRSGCRLQLSAPGKYFPGTMDRICVLGGKLTNLENCMVLIVKLVCDIPGTTTTRMLKLAVPNSAVSMVIGHGGELVRRLCHETGCRINASMRMHNMQERLIILAGAHDALVRASLEVLRVIQEDPHLKEHIHFPYEDIELPLGAWAGPQAQVEDESVPLIHPSTVAQYSKRQLVEYLRKAAPLEILMRYSLFGSTQNAMKSQGAGKLADAVSETWRLRGGAMTEAVASSSSSSLARNAIDVII